MTKINPDKFAIKWIGGKGNTNNRLIPFLDNQLSYFLGLVVGDGHLYENRIVISAEEKVAKEMISPHCQKTFPNMKIIVRDMKDCFWVELNSRPLVWFVRDIFGIPIGRKTRTVRIPNLLFSSSEQIICSFMRGLFDADGCAEKSRRLSLFTISENLKDDVIIVLKRVGITPIIKIDKRTGVFMIRIYGKSNFRMFFDKIGFSNIKKQTTLKNLC